jgi:hypothetical protein
MAQKKQNNDTLGDRVFTTQKIIDIEEKENLGYPLKQYERIWFKNQKGVRRSNITFAMTNDEVSEYAKCKLSVHYFAEKYCKIKLDDGSIGSMKLRNYQKDIIDLYTKNRFSILMASRQIGKCISAFTRLSVVDDFKKEVYDVPFYELYYSTIKLNRKLNFLEKIKYFLYKLHDRI